MKIVAFRKHRYSGQSTNRHSKLIHAPRRLMNKWTAIHGPWQVKPDTSPSTSGDKNADEKHLFFKSIRVNSSPLGIQPFPPPYTLLFDGTSKLLHFLNFRFDIVSWTISGRVDVRWAIRKAKDVYWFALCQYLFQKMVEFPWAMRLNWHGRPPVRRREFKSRWLPPYVSVQSTLNSITLARREIKDLNLWSHAHSHGSQEPYNCFYKKHLRNPKNFPYSIPRMASQQSSAQTNDPSTIS